RSTGPQPRSTMTGCRGRAGATCSVKNSQKGGPKRSACVASIRWSSSSSVAPVSDWWVGTRLLVWSCPIPRACVSVARRRARSPSTGASTLSKSVGWRNASEIYQAHGLETEERRPRGEAAARVRVIEELRDAALHYAGCEETNSQQQESCRSGNATLIVEAGQLQAGAVGDGGGEFQRERSIGAEGIEVGLREGVRTSPVQPAELITAPRGDGIEVGGVEAGLPGDRPVGGAADRRAETDCVRPCAQAEIRVTELDGQRTGTGATAHVYAVQIDVRNRRVAYTRAHAEDPHADGAVEQDA